MDARDITPSRAHESIAKNRTSAERDEWRVAGELGVGLERARLALAINARRVEHAAAEGASYV